MAFSFANSIILLHVDNPRNWFWLCSILSSLFEPVSNVIMFYVFYTIIHFFREQISGEQMTKMKMKVFTITKYMHWGILGLFAALVIIDWGWLISWRTLLVHDEIVFLNQNILWDKIDSTRCILFWLGAWEIVGWAFYLGIMSSRDSSKVKLKVSKI